MRLSWNEIRQRAIGFGREWKEASYERGEAQTFWNEFFEVFGRTRRTVAAYEEPVKNLKNTYSFIDLFWPGMMIAEHKSRGKSLEKAESQAFAYVRSLIDSGRDEEVPRYLVVSDFARITITDLEEDTSVAFAVEELHEHIREFAFISGYKQVVLDPEDPVNIEAAEKLAKLKDALEAGGYPEHELERFMVRILFCLFAEDTGLLGEPDAFRLYLENTTRVDGSDLGLHLAQWFAVLDQPVDTRSENLDEQLSGLQYVNGELFDGRLPFANFTRSMRERLLECCRFDWSKISPAVFGSLFQSIMSPEERRQIGAHYTSERDILKLIKSLFLDELRERFEKGKRDKKKLDVLHRELGAIRILDPACGCGNFLVVSYRELRRLEIDILKALHPEVEGGMGRVQRVFDVRQEMFIDVDQMYGIEIEEWPSQIAKVALWLVDHQMNVELSLVFGEAVARLPLTHSATIRHANALRIDWNDVLPADECSYVLGNPPFVGKKEQNPDQKRDMDLIWNEARGAGTLDYVTCWYFKFKAYIEGNSLVGAFVSTNSITQGEQAGTLWPALLSNDYQIAFAHKTFPWQSEARKPAKVHVVIIGLANAEYSQTKTLHDYDKSGQSIGVTKVESISPYLTSGSPAVVSKRTSPINGAPIMRYGSMMIDKPRKEGNESGLVFGDMERELILTEQPELLPYIRYIYGGEEYINRKHRWCLWLLDASPEMIRSSPEVLRRLEGVRKFRSSSGRARTRELANTPSLFGEIRQPETPYLLVPKVSSEKRDYIPIGFVDPNIIASGSALIVSTTSVYHFGVISSTMHMAWVRVICGRMRSDYQYSARLVYNNYPWPVGSSDKQIAAVEAAAQEVLDVRERYPEASLADLYDPLSMPKDLHKAHAVLDRAVERCYRSQPFPDERRRFEYLFGLWEELDRPLTRATKKKRARKKKD